MKLFKKRALPTPSNDILDKALESFFQYYPHTPYPTESITPETVSAIAPIPLRTLEKEMSFMSPPPPPPPTHDPQLTQTAPHPDEWSLDMTIAERSPQRFISYPIWSIDPPKPRVRDYPIYNEIASKRNWMPRD